MRKLVLGALLALAVAAPVSAGGSSFDVCPNVDGFQARVPGGSVVVIYIDGRWACVPRR